MRIIIIVFILIGSIAQISAQIIAQRELTITEMNSDGAAVIEINGKDPQATDFMQMVLGFNPSSEAWLRTRTNHDLSFWTNNTKRMTINADGNIELKTKDIGALNGTQDVAVNFFTEGVYKGEIKYCDCPADGGDLMNFNLSGDGAYNFKSNGETRMYLGKNGSVKFGGLEGAGQRTVFVNSDGTLSTTGANKYQVLSPVHFQTSETDNGELKYSDLKLSCDFNFGGNFVKGISNPVLPFTKYMIEEIEVFFKDNSSSDEMTFSFDGPLSGDVVTSSSSGSSSSEQSITMTINSTIDQEQGDNFDFEVTFRDDDNHNYYRAIIKYLPIY